ncbi:MAG: response regulator transcription factor [Acidobacteria bacterium]|nr:response regulator transcription factor [Acidobacteriota bacterium]
MWVEVLELVGGDGVAVIFTTAYDQYAIRAFEVHAVDYLLKPFSAERLEAALKRALDRLGAPATSAPELAAAARPAGAYASRVVVRDGAKVHIIPVEQLEYAEAQDDYVLLHAAGKRYLKLQTISSLEAALDPRHFVRIHRGTLVNLERVARLEPFGKDSRVAVLKDGTQLAVSRAGYARLSELLDGV